MSKFQVPTNHENPPDNGVIFEEYFGMKYGDSKRKDTDRIYLPVYWTNYYVERDYGKADMSDLQEELNALPRDNEYFTICQWDDGILQDTSGLKLFVYGQGGYGDYAIPLNCVPHGGHPASKFDLTPTLASFVGSIRGRHPIREKMQEVFKDEEDCIVEDRSGKGTFFRFTKVMSQSKFALCPRGYGKTSFRICEALEAGVIPVYIYDEPWIPFDDIIDFNGYGVPCHEEHLEYLPEFLRTLSKDESVMKQLKKNGRTVYKNFYSYEGCRRQILKMEKKYNDRLK